MSIWVNSETKVVVQGLTGKEGRFHAQKCREYGTKIVAGVTPGKAGQDVDGVLNEPAWEQALTLSPFVFADAVNEFAVGEAETTRVSVCYDDAGLLVGKGRDRIDHMVFNLLFLRFSHLRLTF